MCGIAGLIGIAPGLAQPAALRMRAAMRHRGPDADGIKILADRTGAAPPVVLIHTRLAILDLSPAGRQPMCDPDADRWIVFNGEIYNYHELYAELAARGVRPDTRTDTEVIFHAYCAWGDAAVERLRGMFAYALADPAGRHITFARDRLGIKPLYVARPASGGLVFASEVRALLAAGPDLVPPRLHRPAIEAFLAQGAVFGLDSHVAGVRLLPPGETLTVDWRGETIASRRFWAPSFPTNAAAAPDRREAVARLGATAREAVKQHLVADVPVGVFLSSGVDSTVVATLATEAAAGRVRTLSIGFDRPEFDETATAEAFAKQLGTDHRTLRLTAADVLADFDRVLAVIDQPTVDGFNTFYVSRAARQVGLTVALSGLGGDELFGGYRAFRDVPRAVRLLRLAGPVRWAKPVVAAVARRWKSRGLLKAAEGLGRPAEPVGLYLLRREVFRPADRRALLPDPAGADSISGMPPEELARWAAGTTELDPENQVSYLELTGYMRHMLLRDSDVFSMAHGLELRVPLLDHELVDAATALPGVWKRLGPVPKPLLVEAAGPRLPAEVTRLPKRGFTFPWAEWFRKELAATAGERLNDRAVWARLGFDPAAPGRLWDLFRRGDPTVGGVHVLGLVVLADLAARQGLSVA